MQPTHQYTDSRGHVYRGVIVGHCSANLVWFLPLCDDGETWMQIPVAVSGVMLIQP